MNSAKLNDWLTLLANLGIVAGLIIEYLELDHANRLAESNAMQSRDAEIIQAQKDYALSDYLPEIVVKARESVFASLTSVEFSRYLQWERARFQRLFATYRQYELGFITRETVDATVGTVIQQGWLDVWDELGIGITNEERGPFWEELEKARKEAKKNP